MALVTCDLGGVIGASGAEVAGAGSTTAGAGAATGAAEAGAAAAAGLFLAAFGVDVPFAGAFFAGSFFADAFLVRFLVAAAFAMARVPSEFPALRPQRRMVNL